jgi:hypothetical protein
VGLDSILNAPVAVEIDVAVLLLLQAEGSARLALIGVGLPCDGVDAVISESDISQPGPVSRSWWLPMLRPRSATRVLPPTSKPVAPA